MINIDLMFIYIAVLIKFKVIVNQIFAQRIEPLFKGNTYVVPQAVPESDR